MKARHVACQHSLQWHCPSSTVPSCRNYYSYLMQKHCTMCVRFHAVCISLQHMLHHCMLCACQYSMGVYVVMLDVCVKQPAMNCYVLSDGMYTSDRYMSCAGLSVKHSRPMLSVMHTTSCTWRTCFIRSWRQKTRWGPVRKTNPGSCKPGTSVKGSA